MADPAETFQLLMISRSECQEIAGEIERLIFDETPSKLGESIGRELDDYSVAFLIVKDGMLRPAGTGTAVTFLGLHYFLTASHVWYGKYGHDGLRAADTIVIPLKENTRRPQSNPACLYLSDLRSHRSGVSGVPTSSCFVYLPK